jgi:DNA-binding response OmpR family regulator
VCEDDEDAREMLMEFFRTRGASPIGAASGEEALAALAANKVDVMVCDLVLPDWDGLKLIREVRARAGDLPAIALTAFASREHGDEALSAGFDFHLPKPTPPLEVWNLIMSAPRRTRARDDGDVG